MPPTAELCTDRFRELADSLGGVRCEGAHPVGYLNDPTSLASWTMPVVEVVFIGGALLALAHGVRRLRRAGDATGLGVWLAAVVYVVVLEPPLYFPAAFGIDDYVPAIFVHNEFTVGFLYNRMPLYILSLYPCLVYLAWTIVQRFGLEQRHSGWRLAAVTGMCVGFVHQSIYEVFDQFGPQHLWWAWDYDQALTDPRVGVVPWSSIVNFALVMPAAFAFVAVLLLQRRPRPTLRAVLLPAVGVGVLTPLVSMPGQLPVTLLDVAPGVPVTLIGVVLVAMTLGAALITLRELRHARVPDAPAGFDRDYAAWFLAAYLVVFAMLWLTADPTGTPSASWAHAMASFAISVLVLARIARPRRDSPTRERPSSGPEGRPGVGLPPPATGDEITSRAAGS